MEHKTKKILGIILQVPLVLIVIAGFFASIYLAYKKSYGISYATSIIFGIIIALYFIGIILSRKKEGF